ncbi:MAG: hypothetical protein AAB932_00725 [Patescibacteria group bacterium]
MRGFKIIQHIRIHNFPVQPEKLRMIVIETDAERDGVGKAAGEPEGEIKRGADAKHYR